MSSVVYNSGFRVRAYVILKLRPGLKRWLCVFPSFLPPFPVVYISIRAWLCFKIRGWDEGGHTRDFMVKCMCVRSTCASFSASCFHMTAIHNDNCTNLYLHRDQCTACRQLLRSIERKKLIVKGCEGQCARVSIATKTSTRL